VVANDASVKDIASISQDSIIEVKAASEAVKQNLKEVKDTIRSANAKFITMQNKLNNMANEVYLDIAAIAGGILELIQAPALMFNSLSSKILMLANLGKNIMKNFPSGSTYKAGIINSALVGQFFINTAISVMARSIISDMPETRREALSILNEYLRFSAETQSALDAVAELTKDEYIEKQFLPRVNSGDAISTLNTAVVKYILETLCSLKIERRMTLDKPRAPLEIAITEYKASADNVDYFYNFFCKTNNLHGREMLLLKAGREIVIYA
jgi:hypothetical protein